MKQVYDAFKEGEVSYKSKPIPFLRVDITRFEGDFPAIEGFEVPRVPKFAFHTQGRTYEYGETFMKSFILHFVNRRLYPVALLKTEEEIERFIDTNTEWVENTPFYNQSYQPFGEFFPQFRKVTRVIAFLNDKNDFKEEMKHLNKAAMDLADREDLRIAKVTNPALVKKYKEKYDLKWFSQFSSNSLVMLKKDANRPEFITKYYDLNIETTQFIDWISQQSLEPLEELSAAAFKIIGFIKKPMFMVYLNRTHPVYGPESVELYNILSEIAEDYPQFTFTFTEEDRYRASKKDLDITWDEEPSMSLNQLLYDQKTVFPRDKPFTKKNVVKFISGIIDGSIKSKKFKLPDSKQEYVKHLKNVKNVKTSSFYQFKNDDGKDVAVLFFNSNKLDHEGEKTIKSFGKAARRFKDLKVKSVKMGVYDLGKQSPIDGIEFDSKPKVYVFPANSKSEPYTELMSTNTERIMKDIESHADIKFTLPNFPHLDETEFVQLEAGTHTEDL